MGGNAIKTSERVSKETLFKYAEEIIPILKESFRTDIFMTYAYRNKADYGDLDLLILNNNNSTGTNRRDIIIKLFDPEEISANSNIVSFGYKELQVDLIFIEPHKWNTSKVFYSYDPVGNLMGKLLNRFNLKYGDYGLSYRYININGRYNKDIIISTNSEEIFKFLGLNYDKFILGFDDLKDIYDFIIDSKFFNKDIFKLNNLTSSSRSRNKKRSTYLDFLDYIKDMDFDPIYNIDTSVEYIDRHFNGCNLIEMIQEQEKLVKLAMEVSIKFNGNIIMQHFPDLRGNELGKVLKKFNETYDSQFIICNDISVLLNKVYEILKKIRNENT